MTTFTDLQKEWNEKFREKFIHHDDSLAQPFMLLNTLDIPRLSSFLSEMATAFYEAGRKEEAKGWAEKYEQAKKQGFEAGKGSMDEFVLSDMAIEQIRKEGFEAGQMAVHSKDGAAFDAGLKRGMELALNKVREVTEGEKGKWKPGRLVTNARRSAYNDVLAAITKLEEEHKTI